MKRTVFFVSDSTGITAEVMGEALLSHFSSIEFVRQTLPYVNDENSAMEAAARINAASATDGKPPIIFDTLVNETVREVILKADGVFIDVINTFLAPLEAALETPSNYNVGRPKIAGKNAQYNRRIAAIHYALENDDGARINRYGDADIILIGVSRSGKTPTCLYMALQFGIFPANYPITDDDLEDFQLPRALRDHRDKLFGLTIQADRLASIRNERLSGSRYASPDQCEREIHETRSLFEHYDIPFIDTTDFSIEEISTRILAKTGIERKFG